VAISAPTTRAADLIPEQPPKWVDTQLEATGRSLPRSSSILTLRAAVADARQALMRQVQNLLLSSKVRLSQAMDVSPAVGQSVDRALEQAQVDRVEFDEAGGVQVRMTLEAWRLWRELNQ
jgi:hypothetical protein